MGKINVATDTYLVGMGVSPGIAIGKVNLIDQRPLVDQSLINGSEVDAEISRFQQAIDQAREQLQKIKKTVSKQPHLREHLYILDTHLLILEDEMLVEGTKKEIRALVNVEGALTRVLEKLRALFDSIDDEYLRERRSDVDAVGDRLLRILMGVSERNIDKIGSSSIVVAHDLSPAETIQMDRSHVLGFITGKGGRTSHTAILARSLDIPAVVGLESITAMVVDGMTAIVDGFSGVVILKPSEKTLQEYLIHKQSYDCLEQDLEQYRDLPSITKDQVHIPLRGNLEISSDVIQIKKHAAEGIGLYRTEFLYLGRSAPPDEEEQFQSYCEILKQAEGDPVTIRTLDIGGDKFVPELNLDDEANPAMGLRAIRFSLHEEQLFKIQLRAILRASSCGRVRILFPMISGVAEIRACKKMLGDIQAQLDKEGISYDPDLAIGIMIETPSAVMIAPLLAKEVDFFSVGTNDLIQYFLAVDRGNEHVAYLYDPLHPAILRALKMTCDAANEAGIEVCICGEMAGEPLYALVLVGLGFHELSMNPACVPRVKRVLRQVSKQDGATLVKQLLLLSTSKEVSTIIEAEMRRRLPAIFAQPPIQ
ncbi:phosphoenolpyruvate--protein phosphotransferase [Desulfuromusa kysingii]|uniref:Phosphoenolpyruvate-protein phosphotransferase n=1 Tax=Desulfuromusa kysingii TaxID=37625 RepID=A0A1H3ZN10_9BACT|nr:phosphoenolpyruvate--protein phosphotransferase [Desulfuromusa kysingii]SEA25035.1 phosphoenolpyruvate--protein phosphotransferase [Desulfuromusa kysingii]